MYRFTIDTTSAGKLTEWCYKNIGPNGQGWTYSLHRIRQVEYHDPIVHRVNVLISRDEDAMAFKLVWVE